MDVAVEPEIKKNTEGETQREDCWSVEEPGDGSKSEESGMPKPEDEKEGGAVGGKSEMEERLEGVDKEIGESVIG